MLVPMIGFIQVGSQPRADRYTYLPQIGLYIVATWGAIELCKKWRHKREVLTVAAGLVIVALLMRSYFQTSYWRDSETLWRHAIDVTGGNYIAYNNLAGTLLEKGQFNEAITYYKHALEIKPNVAPVQSHLAKALLEQGQIDEAVTHLQKALEVDPNYAEAYNHLGTASLKRGQTAEGVAYYQKAL
jgi:tetratricopeptide (TPR) repeat protein